jgi:hypothetical protein
MNIVTSSAVSVGRSKLRQTLALIRSDPMGCVMTARRARTLHDEQRRIPAEYYPESNYRRRTMTRARNGAATVIAGWPQTCSHATVPSPMDVESSVRHAERTGHKSTDSACPRDVMAARLRHRYNTNVQYRLRKNLHNRLWWALGGKVKSAGTMALLGCTIAEFKTHLEAAVSAGYDLG